MVHLKTCQFENYAEPVFWQGHTTFLAIDIVNVVDNLYMQKLCKVLPISFKMDTCWAGSIHPIHAGIIIPSIVCYIPTAFYILTSGPIFSCFLKKATMETYLSRKNTELNRFCAQNSPIPIKSSLQYTTK